MSAEVVEGYARQLFAQVDGLHGDTWEGTTQARRDTLLRLAHESFEAAERKSASKLTDGEVARLRGAISALDWADLTETIAEHTREIATIRTLVEKLIGGAA